MTLSVEMRARYARFQEELDTTGECKGLGVAICHGDGEVGLLDQEREST